MKTPLNYPTLTMNHVQYALVPVAELRRLLPPPPRTRSAPAPAWEEGPASLQHATARSLIKRRTAKGWSQADLAKQAGLRLTTVMKIEQGGGIPSDAIARKLDKAFRKTK